MSYDGASVLGAIQTWWSVNGTGRKLWYKSAAENGNILPYETYFLVSETNEAPTTGFDFYRSTVQINFHDVLPELARATGETFRRAIRKAPLTIGGSPVLHVLTDDNMLEEGEGLGPSGQDCWVAMEVLDIPWTE